MPRLKKPIKQFRYADNHPDYARVIRKSSDSSFDVFIPRTIARQLFNEGKLAIDQTNSKPNEIIYCPPFKGFSYERQLAEYFWSHPDMKKRNQLIEVERR
jgi:hypothetical protein